MATTEQIAELRRYINEPDDTAPWTDGELSSRIDGYEGTLQGLASTLWAEKAASYSELTDVREGNSQRSLSKLHQQALLMSTHYQSVDPEFIRTRRFSRTRPIERP